MCYGSEHAAESGTKGWENEAGGGRFHYFPSARPCYSLCGIAYLYAPDGTPRRPKNACKTCVRLKGKKKAK